MGVSFHHQRQHEAHLQYHDLSQNGTSAYALWIPAGAGLGFHSVSWAMSRTHHGYCHWCWRWAEVSYDSLYLHAPLCRQCSGRPLATHDHGYCYWCWRWAEVWYSGMSVFNMPLCNSCARRHLHGLGPPWYPNHVQRCELLIRRVFHRQANGTRYLLPDALCVRIAGFMADPWRP